MTTPVIPKGYRILEVGEFVPGNAKYLSMDGLHWRCTPAAGQPHTDHDGVLYICPIHDTGTHVGSETLSDSSGEVDVVEYLY